MMIFNNFPDKVVWGRQQGKDAFGNPKLVEVEINARRAQTIKDFKGTDNSIQTVYVDVYHVPMDHDISTNDTLDGHRIDSVNPVRGADNVYQYKRVICE